MKTSLVLPAVKPVIRGYKPRPAYAMETLPEPTVDEKLKSQQERIEMLELRSGCDILWKVLGVLTVIATLIVVIVSAVTTGHRLDSLHRVAIDVPDRAWGKLSLDSSSGTFTYEVFYHDLGAPLVGLYVWNRRTNALGTVLCGGSAVPGVPTCDVTTVPGSVRGSIDLVYDGVQVPPPLGKVLVDNIRGMPAQYELRLMGAGEVVLATATMANTAGYP